MQWPCRGATKTNTRLKQSLDPLDQEAYTSRPPVIALLRHRPSGSHYRQHSYLHLSHNPENRSGFKRYTIYSSARSLRIAAVSYLKAALAFCAYLLAYVGVVALERG